MFKKGQKVNKTYTELTTKQQRFIDYFDGNKSKAAEKAGYSHPGTAGNRLYKNVNIVLAIRDREVREREPEILTRKERQIFWSNITSGKLKEKKTIASEDGEAEDIEAEISIRDRMKASELLGRSQADFTDKIALGSQGEDDKIRAININLFKSEKAQPE